VTRFPLPPTISKGGASLSGDASKQKSIRCFFSLVVWRFHVSNNRHFTIQGSGVLGSSYYCVQRRGRALACFVKSTLLIFDVAIQQQPMGAIEIVLRFLVWFVNMGKELIDLKLFLLGDEIVVV
jgi:hypothetical protein